MQPPSNVDFFNVSNTDVIQFNICSQMCLKDLNTFSRINTACSHIFRKCLEGLIYKRRLLENFFPVVLHDYTERKIYTTQSAITKTDVFFSYRRAVEGVGLYMAYIKQVSLLTNKEIRNIEINHSLANSIEKIVPYANGLYLLCKNINFTKKEENKTLVFMNATSALSNGGALNCKYSKVDLALDSKFLEVYENEAFTNLGPDSIGIYDTIDKTLKKVIKCEQASSTNEIVGIKIDGGSLYVRLTSGEINIYSLKSKNRINTILGPDCKSSQEHFEVRGNYLYTSSKFKVTKWLFSNDFKEIKNVCEIELMHPSANANPDRFMFQIDGTIIYIGLSNRLLEAYDCETFEFLNSVYNFCMTNPKEEIKSCYANAGVLVSIFSKNAKNFYRIMNFNPPRINLNETEANQKTKPKFKDKVAGWMGFSSKK